MDDPAVGAVRVMSLHAHTCFGQASKYWTEERPKLPKPADVHETLTFHQLFLGTFVYYLFGIVLTV